MSTPTTPAYQHSTVRLVAFEVCHNDDEHPDDVLISLGLTPVHPSTATSGRVDSWWVAEDDRKDASDNDSAVFLDGFAGGGALSQATADAVLTALAGRSETVDLLSVATLAVNTWLHPDATDEAGYARLADDDLLDDVTGLLCALRDALAGGQS